MEPTSIWHLCTSLRMSSCAKKSKLAGRFQGRPAARSSLSDMKQGQQEEHEKQAWVAASCAAGA